MITIVLTIGLGIVVVSLAHSIWVMTYVHSPKYQVRQRLDAYTRGDGWSYR